MKIDLKSSTLSKSPSLQLGKRNGCQGQSVSHNPKGQADANPDQTSCLRIDRLCDSSAVVRVEGRTALHTLFAEEMNMRFVVVANRPQQLNTAGHGRKCNWMKGATTHTICAFGKGVLTVKD